MGLSTAATVNLATSRQSQLRNFGIVGKNATDSSKPPGLFYAITNSIGIFEDRITRSRLAGDPADVVLSPAVAQIGMLEFSRAGEAIEEGERCVREALSEIRRVTGVV